MQSTSTAGHGTAFNALTSIRAKLAYSVLAFVLVAGIIMAYAAAHLVRSSTEPAVGAQHYVLMQGVADRLDVELGHRIDELRAIGEAVLTRRTTEPAALRERMALIPSLTRHFWNVSVIDPEGNLLADLRGPTARKLNIAQRAFFIKASQSGVPVVSDPLRGSMTDKPFVAVIVPIKVDERIQFFIAGGIDLDSQELLRTLSSGPERRAGEVILTSADGTLISHPNPAWVMHAAAEAPGTVRYGLAAIGRGLPWAIGPDGQGGSAIFSGARLKHANWTVIGSYPYQAAFSELETMRTGAAAAAVGLALAAGLLGWLLAHRVIGPLQRLQQEVGRLERGESGGSALVTTRSDEIGELSNQFYRLVVAKDANEARAREHEAFARTLLACAPDGVILCNASGDILEWNLQAQAIFGWSAVEAMGRKVADLIVPPELQEEHRQGMARFAGSGHGTMFGQRTRLPAQRKDGTRVMVELSLAPIGQQGTLTALAFVRDVTQQIADEERLATSERRLQMVADNVPALIAYVDRHQRYVFSNAQYQRLLGIDQQRMIGRPIRDVLGAEFYARIRGRIEMVLAGKDVHFETSRRVGKRTLHLMADLIADRQVDGQVRGFYTLVTDVTQRKQVEMQQAESEQRAEAASRAKSEFVAHISHEIRTPMNAVLGMAQLLENTALQDEQREYLSIIRASGLSLVAILNDVLDFSKIEAGRMVLEHERYDIETVLDGAAALLAANAAGKDIEVVVGIGAEVPRYLMGDFVRVQQVVANLVSNAVKFTAKGHVSLMVDVAAEGRLLRLCVDDTGIGITPEQQTRIFESFEQADASTARQYGGTGLGLTITRRLVDMMDGQIGLVSIPGEGALFTVTLPLVPAADHSRPQRGTAAMLLIDGSACSRQMFVSTLAYCGFTAYAYATLEDALNAAERHLFEPVQMSHVLLAAGCRGNEAEVMAMLRAYGLREEVCPYWASTPFERRARTYRDDTGGYPLLMKPLTPKILRQTVERFSGKTAMTPCSRLPLRELRLLLVEDNLVNQMIARGMLGNTVAVLDVANNGAEALAILRARPAAFDIVLMDVQMPVMDGYRATEAIRTELGLTVPIVAMTAGVMDEERRRCAAVGMNDFLPKPVVMEELFDVLQRVAGIPPDRPVVSTAAPAPEPASPPVFVPKILQMILDRNPAQLGDLAFTLRQGIAQARREVVQLTEALAAGDHGGAQKILHSMRGALGTLGAKSFADTALAMERTLREKQPVDAAPLGAALVQFASQAEAWVAEQQGADNETDDIQRFLKWLRAQDIKAVAAFEHVRNRLPPTIPEATVLTIGQAVCNLDFDTAVEQLAAYGVRLDA